MNGKLYGVGVGPGDPELMTAKAMRVLRECDTIAIPSKDRAIDYALRIAIEGLPELSEKPILEVDTCPISKDPADLQPSCERGVEILQERLDQGEKVCFITIGDPFVYSTFCYIHPRIAALGYETEIIPGVPSFCAAAAALGIPLCEGDQELHIFSGTSGIEDKLDQPGVRVFLKFDLPQILESVHGRELTVYAAEHCGRLEQRIFYSADEISKDAGYYTTLIVKERASK